MHDLARLKHLILDMDGVLWRGETAFPGIVELFETLAQHKLQYVLATNNSSKTPQQYAKKLAKMGVHISEDRIMTSALVTANVLAERSPHASAKIYLIGGEGLRQALLAKRFTIVERFDRHSLVDYVVVGFDQTVTYDDFAAATLHIRRRATFVGTNADPTYPTEDGQVPGNGAFLALLQAATQTQAMVMGKPELAIFQECLKIFGPHANGQNTAIVGDRLETDIVGGMRAGLQTILILTGVTKEQELNNSRIRPTHVVSDIASLLELIKTGTDKIQA